MRNRRILFLRSDSRRRAVEPKGGGMKKSRPCPGPAAASPCVGAGFIEADRGATAERCKRCSALRARQREAKRRRELTRIAREGWALSATAPVEIPPTADTRRTCPGPDPGSPCGGAGFIEENRSPAAKRCQACSATRTRRLEADRRRKLRREARQLEPDR